MEKTCVPNKNKAILYKKGIYIFFCRVLRLRDIIKINIKPGLCKTSFEFYFSNRNLFSFLCQSSILQR